MKLSEQVAALSSAVATLTARVGRLEARETQRRARPTSYPRAGGTHHRYRQGAIPADARTDAYGSTF